MKVVTWNCNQAFRKKYENILSYKPDLLIVPECEHPDNFKKAFYFDVVWIGNNNKNPHEILRITCPKHESPFDTPFL